jgi:hypothetical protein
MHLLNDGRAAFLEFLRNLTPQAVILSIAIVSGMKLDFTRINLANTGPTLIFWLLVAIWGMAAWANNSLFLEKSLISVRPISRASRLFSLQGLTGIRLTGANLAYSWRNKRIIFIELVVLMVIVEFGLVVVAVSAIFSASSILGMK